MSSKLHFFFIHDGNETRKKACKDLVEILEEGGFKDIVYTFCDKNKTDSFNLEQLAKIIDLNQWRAMKPHLKEYIRKIPIENMSNLLNHYNAITLIANNCVPGDIPIVIEDDVIFDEDSVIEELNFLITEVKKRSDKNITIIGSIPEELCGSSLPSTQCIQFCNAYYVCPLTAGELSKNFLPIAFSLSQQLTMVCQSIGVNVYFHEESIFLDGSKVGAYPSSIKPNNQHLFHKVYMEADAFLKQYDETKHSDSEVIKHIQNIKNDLYGNNPDFIYLEAKLNICIKEYKYARELFKIALKEYLETCSVMRQRSDFVVDYEKVCLLTQDLPLSTFS